MIVTINWQDLDTTHLTWAQQQLVEYLADLRKRRGDVLLFSMRRAIVRTGLKRSQIERGLAMLVKRQAVAVESAMAA